MKIGIDARMYGPQQAGLGRYIEQLVLGLEKFDHENEYVIFVRQIIPGLRFKQVLADVPWYSWQEQTGFLKILNQEKIDLMHFPHWNVPLFYNKPFVVTVHDLIMYHYPRREATIHGPLVYWFKDMVHRLVLRVAVKKAKLIITTSEFTKEDIHKTLGVALEKMQVVYQAPFQMQDVEFRMQNSGLSKFGINKKYVLYVGNAYPHKNLERLLAAWKIFEEKYGQDYQLVLAGKESNNYKLLKSKFSELTSVVFTNFVTDQELISLYQNTLLYIYPSLYEGFGLPPLEAATYSIPIASSNASCLPEVLGEGAIYFDPENKAQMAEIIYQGLTNQNLRVELLTNAKLNLERFDLLAMISQTLQLYKDSFK